MGWVVAFQANCWDGPDYTPNLAWWGMRMPYFNFIRLAGFYKAIIIFMVVADVTRQPVLDSRDNHNIDEEAR